METPSSGQFLQLLYGKDFPGFINVWSKQDKKSSYFAADELDQAVSRIANLAQTKDVYIALGLTAERRAKYQRGTDNKVVALPGFFADIDFAENKKSNKKYPSAQQAMAILEALPIQPTVLTHTGNGLHVLYLLDQLLVIQDDKARREVKRLSNGFQSFIHTAFKKQGFDLDAVGELSRNIRIPGTQNHKSSPLKPVTTLQCEPANRYSLDRMRALVEPFLNASVHAPQQNNRLADHDKIKEECAWYRDCVDNAATCDEPNWYAAASITARCKDGLKIFEEYSKKYAGYNVLEAYQKFARSNADAGPRTCKNICNILGNQEHCSQCPHWGKIQSPVHLGQDCSRFAEYEPGEDGPIPLGFTREGSYALRDQKRNIIVCLSSNQLLAFQNLLGLAPSHFWQEQFPAIKAALFNAMSAGEALMQACRAAGPFNPRKVRGRGVWLEGKSQIINLGDAIADDVEYTYLCFEPIPLRSHDTFETQRMLDLLRLFNWRNPQDAVLLLGWLAIAPICGVLQNRPHCFIYGPPRCGKTTIHTIASRLLDPLVISTDGQSSEAGIRQMLGPDSLPIIIDEFESDQSGGRLRAIIRLARSAYSAETSVFRGTPEGKALQFSLRTTFLYAAINPIGMEPADESRTLLLEMVMHGSDPEIARRIAEEEAYFGDKGQEWCGYLVPRAAKINEAIGLFKETLPGLDSRHRTNIATLLAGAFVALQGRAPSEVEAKSLAEDFKDTIKRHALALDRDDSIECLERLYAHIVDSYPLGHWIGAELAHLQEGGLNELRPSLRILSSYGIKIKRTGDEIGLFIMNGSPAIEKIFANTKWSGRAWERALRKLSGSFHPKIPVYFQGFGKKSRCLGLPLDLIPEPMPAALPDEGY